MADYAKTVQLLYQAPLAKFVAERKRLAAELAAGGNEAAARQLAKLRRPTTSAWTVNQLYWRSRDQFDAMLAAAAPLQKGDLSAASAYREALATLRRVAAGILKDAGHAATDSTLRRVTATLAAIAAAGGFDPDPPGALATDRDPPGFDAVAMPAGFDAVAVPAHPAANEPHGGHGRKRPAAPARAAAVRRVRLEAARAEERAARQKAKAVQAERSRLEANLRDAEAEVRKHEHTLSVLQKEVHAAERAVHAAREIVEELERKLAKLDDGA